MKTSPLRLIVSASIILMLSACSNNKIPINEERARQQVIPIRQARNYTQGFMIALADLKREVKDSSFVDKSFNVPYAEMFNRDAIASLLNVEGADGVRIYLGRDSLGQIRMVLLPVDKNGRNIIGPLVNRDVASIPGISSARAQSGDGDGEAIENGQRCPTMCDESW
jgi:hypothetical protein